MGEPAKISDPQFVQQLRTKIDEYLKAVDQWETAYQKYYRLPGYASILDRKSVV